MTRLAIVAPNSYQEEIIESLHDARLAHIEAYTQGEDEELTIGDPLPAGSEASQILVRLRSVIHTLGLEDAQPETRLDQTEIRSRLDREFPRIEDAVKETARERDELRSRREQVKTEIDRLAPLRDLPLRLEDYRGYDSLEVFVGTAPEDIQGPLSSALERFEVFPGEEATAVFVATDRVDKAQEILTREGFQQIEVPEGEGSVDTKLTELERTLDDLEASLAEAREELARLAEEHKDLLLCAEEDLSIDVEKAEAPLDFASTERTFIVDTWVPTEDIDALKRIVGEAARGRVHFEYLDDGDREEHHREQEPPTRYDHPTGVAPFAFLMDTFSTPKYDEIDPTTILSIVFPLFFGFMIGDLGYGILMMALGAYLWRAVGAKSEAARSIGFSLLTAGIWASLFGGIVFRDALGIPMYVDPGHMTWPSLLGLSVGAGEPMLHKLAQAGVKSMLALSILAAFVHLFLGFTFAFVNHLGHDAKHAFAQVGWVATLTGLFLLTLLNGPANAVSAWVGDGLGLVSSVEWSHGHVETLEFTSLAGMLPWYALAPGVLILVITEGFMGLMETFGLLSNIISYTRLAGVAVAKGAMALAFNGIFLEDMVLHGEGALLLVAGFVLFVIAQLIVFVLGMISSSIQGIRLNYVEFFLKFFEGGGERFSPFGRERKFTVTTD